MKTTALKKVATKPTAVPAKPTAMKTTALKKVATKPTAVPAKPAAGKAKAVPAKPAAKTVALPRKPEKNDPAGKTTPTKVITKRIDKKEAILDAQHFELEEVKHAEESPADAPHIECRLLVAGLSVLIDPSNLERTLGAGTWGRGLGLVDSWPEAVWTGLLTHLGLPAFPLDRKTAEKPVKRLVQKLWYQAINPAVLEARKAVFDARDTAAAQEYVPVAAETSERVIAAKAKRAETATAYVPTAKLKGKDVKFGGQAGFLLEAFRKREFAPMGTQQAADAMVAGGMKTTTKPERISAFYLCQWVKLGLLERT